MQREIIGSKKLFALEREFDAPKKEVFKAFTYPYSIDKYRIQKLSLQ